MKKLIHESKRCAIYARKSTEQDRDGDDRSVNRQIADARDFAEARGWTIEESHVYVDDAVSGAEVKRLRARQRLLDHIRDGATFDVLLLRNSSRFSRRDGDEAFAELKAISKAGVEIWFTEDGTQFKHGTFESNVIGFMKSESAAEYRRFVTRQTSDAMFRKARAGHVTGGRVFGYDNVRVNGHVERRINEGEAAIVRRIFERSAAGDGLATIASELNADGVPATRSATGWAPGTVRAILLRDLYRGEIVYGKSKKRDADGARHQRPLPESRWIRVPAPELRIVSPEIEAATAARRASMAARRLPGRVGGRPPGQGSPYLLVGLLRCGVCGGTMEVLSRQHGSQRRFAYHCYAARRKGAAVCANRLPARLDEANAAVVAEVTKTLLDPAVLRRAMDYALTVLAEDGSEERRAQMTRRLATLDKECRNLSDAIARGGSLDALLEDLQARDQERRNLRKRLEALETEAGISGVSRSALRARLSASLSDVRNMLLGDETPQAQALLRRLVRGRLTFAPQADGTYQFTGKGTVEPVLAGVIPNVASPAGTADTYAGVPKVASPTGFEPVFWP